MTEPQSALALTDSIGYRGKKHAPWPRSRRYSSTPTWQPRRSKSPDPPARTGRVIADLIPQLPDSSRVQAVDAFTTWALDRLNLHLDDQALEKFSTVLSVLRGPELELLYHRLANVRSPHMRARAQAAVLRQAAPRKPTSFGNGWQLHQDWPGDFDTARLMELIGASAWWINRNGGRARHQ